MSNKNVEWHEEAAEDLTDKQKRIMEVAVLNPEMSNEEIAVEADSSASYVRDIRDRYEDKIEVDDGDSGSAFFYFLILAALVFFGAQQAGLL